MRIVKDSALEVLDGLFKHRRPDVEADLCLGLHAKLTPYAQRRHSMYLYANAYSSMQRPRSQLPECACSAFDAASNAKQTL